MSEQRPKAADLIDAAAVAVARTLYSGDFAAIRIMSDRIAAILREHVGPALAEADRMRAGLALLAPPCPVDRARLRLSADGARWECDRCGHAVAVDDPAVGRVID